MSGGGSLFSTCLNFGIEGSFIQIPLRPIEIQDWSKEELIKKFKIMVFDEIIASGNTQ